MDISGKVAVVTGASRGIGRAIALALATAGADVVCAARSTDASPSKLPGTIDETARQVETLGGRALALPVNVGSEEEVEAMVQGTLERFGRVDILVNNAAIDAPGTFLEVPVKHWDLVINVNLRGAYLCTRAILPTMMRQGGGCIINISSMASRSSGSWSLAYSVSKAALEALTTDLAAEVAPHNITVNALQIERLVASEGFVYLTPDADHSSWEKPEAVAQAVLWLVTRDTDYNGRVVTLADIDREQTAP